MRNSSVKTDIHLKGFKDIPAAWLQEAAFMKNFVTDRREALLWFFSVQQTQHGQIRTDGADKRWYWFWKNSAIFKSGCRDYASTGGNIFTDQLYLAVCTMIVATVWALYSSFCILDLPKTPSTVRLWFFFFFFCLFVFVLVLTSSPFPLLPTPEGGQLQISVLSGHFHPKSARYDPRWL